MADAAAYLGLPEHHVQAAVDYYADLTEEVDEHDADDIAAWLRAAGHDVVTVSERGRKGIDDESLSTLALAEGRALLTSNARDFPPLVGRWTASGDDPCAP